MAALVDRNGAQSPHYPRQLCIGSIFRGSLKEFYWLKVNQFLLASQSLSVHRALGRRTSEDEVRVLKDEAIGALSALIRHWKVCYGMADDRAA